ncbi:DNA repair protein RecN [Chakrabartyella piscis]|uniref:DNA repair protein RecN n=1 Tax=Chakrabartyella piscis TaxID=2918914 RepID=UPI00295899F2|nr:DNA repair protein RecN [Chakrabartyella piscis]
MLEHLHIQNVALIAASQIAFGAGLNVLTGETGAGKSMLIDSLQFALGGRVQKDFLRRGEKMAVVEAMFSVENPELFSIMEEKGLALEDDGCLLITRTYSENGKSLCRINGNMVSVGMLKEIASDLVDFYGQHEHQSLLKVPKHISLLDRYCGETFIGLLQEYKTSYEARKEILKELNALWGDDVQMEQKLDILRYQKDEIESANLRMDEEEELLESKKKLSHMERLIRLVGESLELLYDGSEHNISVSDALGSVLHKLEECSGIDEDLAEYTNRINGIYADLEDVSRELKRYSQNLEDDPESLEEIENRLQVIYKLKRKYGGSVEAVFSFYEKITKELNYLTGSEQELERLQMELETTERKLEKLSTQLTALRKETAKNMEDQIMASLQDMEMKHARFAVSFQEKEDFGSLGKDKIEFLISTNAGEALKPLAKIASGGEMSRIMLALKGVLVDADEIGTFVFDEIDTGVSGRTAGKVGDKMSEIGKKRQILCITHLPQIAAKAEAHYLIEKEEKEDTTISKVTQLTEDATISEIARLMGGYTITDATMAAAMALRKNK